jgi:hypothetical protein
VTKASLKDDPPPVPPTPPELEDCCHSGCDPCVFDLHEDALERYRIALAAWESRHAHAAAKSRPRRSVQADKPARPRT